MGNKDSLCFICVFFLIVAACMKLMISVWILLAAPNGAAQTPAGRKCENNDIFKADRRRLVVNFETAVFELAQHGGMFAFFSCEGWTCGNYLTCVSGGL